MKEAGEPFVCMCGASVLGTTSPTTTLVYLGDGCRWHNVITAPSLLPPTNSELQMAMWSNGEDVISPLVNN